MGGLQTDAAEGPVALVHPADGPGASQLLGRRTWGVGSRMHCPLRPSFWSRVYGLQGGSSGETCGPDLLFFLSLDSRCFESGTSQSLGHGVQPSLVMQDLWSV